MAQARIDRILVLSTAHLPLAVLNDLGARAHESLPFCGGKYGAYGYFAHVNDNDDGTIPAAMFECMRHARRLGCDFIAFDCDAATCDGITIYDHEEEPQGQAPAPEATTPAGGTEPVASAAPAAEETAIGKKGSLASWTEFVRELPVPAELMPALISTRSELVGIVAPRAMTAEEVGVIYQLIAGLIDTNNALRQHAQQIANLVDGWSSTFKGLATLGGQIGDLAHFRQPAAPESDEG